MPCTILNIRTLPCDNHTRNVLRTPANNKLRMEDRRGEEHIKLATEYGKTQLNSGHLVDSQGSVAAQAQSCAPASGARYVPVKDCLSARMRRRKRRVTHLI